jgi:acetylornithine deacetylase
MKIDQQHLLKTLIDLVKINSVNPMLVPEAPGETEIGAYIADTLRKMSVETSAIEIKPGRANIIGIIRGTGGGKSLMLNGHMDTVGVHGMSDPFSAEVHDGRLYGRGAHDMKGGLAAMLGALKTIADSRIRLKGDLIFAAVTDEEYGSIGTESLTKTHKTDAAIVAEPTDLNVCIAHKGFSVFEIETSGRAAHGARYMDGIDANLHMGRVLGELERHSRQLLERRNHPLLGPPSLLVPLIQGGTHQFVYSDKCTISVERRTLPGETHESVGKELEGILNTLRDQDSSFGATLKAVMSRNAYEISCDAEIVRTVAGSVSTLFGGTPGYVGHLWWEDSGLLAEAGIDTVIIGSKGGGIHSHEEWVNIQSVFDLAHVLADAAVRYCS